MTLNRHQAVCGGYATIFNNFCRLAGLTSEVIVGNSRGYGFDPMAEQIGPPSHAWNAVQYKDNWCLVDVTWDAGYLQSGRFASRYSTEFLFLPPEEFIKTRFPELPGWLLLDRQVTRESYPSVPHESPALFDRGITALKPNTMRTISSRATADFVATNPGAHRILLTCGALQGSQRRIEIPTDASGQSRAPAWGKGVTDGGGVLVSPGVASSVMAWGVPAAVQQVAGAGLLEPAGDPRGGWAAL